MQVIALAFLSVISFQGAVVSSTARATAREDRAVIQRRRVVLVRRGQLAKEFPHKNRAIVTYPIVSGLRDPQVLRRVRSLLELKNIFDYSLKEYTEDAWLSEFGYVVNHNGNSLLDITFTQSGSAAYPDDQEKHFLINLRDGSVVKALDAFESDKLASLAVAVDRKLQQEVREIAAENARDTNSEPGEKEAIKQAHENLKFEVSNLDEFSLGRKGITFLYDAGFPHVVQALEPAGRYLFTFAELKPYIKADGPLGQFVR